MIADYRYDTVADFVGRELGVSEWQAVEQSMIDAFAASTGDHQWIHVDAARCRRESPFGTPIAHGFLTLSLITSLQMKLGVLPADATRAINCGANEVRFMAPVLVGDRVRARVVLKSAESKGTDRVLITTSNVMEIEGKDKPALTADLVAMLYK